MTSVDIFLRALTICCMARAYDGPAAHRPRSQRPQRGNPAPPDPLHPPLGHSVDPPADHLPDPHATAAPAHLRSSREPGFKGWPGLQFELRPWPQHRPPRCRSAAISVRRQASPQHRCEPCLKKSVRCGGVRNKEQGTRNEEVRNGGQGNPGTDSGLFPFAVESRAPGVRVARVAVVRGENWPSKSPH
jgi:hypothetical protein